MLNQQFIGRVALPIFAAVLPFMIVAGQLGLDVCRWWIVYGTATIVAVLMGITTFGVCNSNGPGLAVSRSWALFWVSLATLTAVQGYFYAEFRDQCPVLGPIIAIDAFLEWLIAPVVLVVVAGSALRRAWIAARRKGKAPGV
ncbi:Uncharacterised protein [Mycolicibacterium phlei]|uniref:hypothetical protein n=1 Tax=Mycobacteroides chelonae TaxID=1774 RepID=UPI0006197DB7|nr:hypothetical protein [Mycobacteroides chelonae]ANA99835.1 hypothetical protein BB28_19805 [Mycobacteroides chelonae CCUG 47445]OLT82368.1 hypothetical protein BKG56_09880 [Mycobacteroides chelonae]ORV15929.1 hypothetical protein AWB96_07975 [Mycobacteroides chelonae]VEG19748.1 Uncharacterised protein [Mycolicibacterium phlei]